jgi:hypothetical protein
MAKDVLPFLARLIPAFVRAADSILRTRAFRFDCFLVLAMSYLALFPSAESYTTPEEVVRALALIVWAFAQVITEGLSTFLCHRDF